jgi:hypothetical protein
MSFPSLRFEELKLDCGILPEKWRISGYLSFVRPVSADERGNHSLGKAIGRKLASDIASVKSIVHVGELVYLTLYFPFYLLGYTGFLSLGDLLRSSLSKEGFL